MTKLAEVKAWLDDQLARLIAQHDVPAATVAISVGGEVVEAAAGLLSRATGVEATADSVFQIGSVTKVWTATLVMQLVQEGTVDLDAPLRRYLPEFRVADEAASAQITVRQLLTHTAGFEGDIFTDTGPGDDALQTYVAGLGDVAQLFAPGEQFSYNNAGYCVLGRLVEVLRDRTFDACLRDYVITPLGLTHVATSAAEAILFRAAVGHLSLEPGAPEVPAPIWAMARSNAPAGSLLTMRARDLLAFAAMHLEGGAAADGTMLLESATVGAMQQRQVELPDLRVLGNAWGLGWELYDTAGKVVIGHDGNTLGQASFLRLVPGAGVAVVLLTNGGNGHGLYRDVLGHVLAELADVETPALPVPPVDPPRIDASRYVGTYSSLVADLEVTQDENGQVWVEQRPKDIIDGLSQQAERQQMVAFASDALIPLHSQHGLHMPHVFIGDDGNGHARFLHIGRAMPRVEN
jgi:CubicO group peptidase (beta-lactamase class C family)